MERGLSASSGTQYGQCLVILLISKWTSKKGFEPQITATKIRKETPVDYGRMP
jgi:hypothetical protein